MKSERLWVGATAGMGWGGSLVGESSVWPSFYCNRLFGNGLQMKVCLHVPSWLLKALKSFSCLKDNLLLSFS